MTEKRQPGDKKWGVYLMGGGILSAILFAVVLALASSFAPSASPAQPTPDPGAVGQEMGQAVGATLTGAALNLPPLATATHAFSPTTADVLTGDTPAPAASLAAAGTPTLTAAPGEVPTPTQELPAGNTPTPTRTPPTGGTPAPTRTVTRTAAPDQITAGTYLVGPQIQPGIYLGVPQNDEGCYWQRLSNLSGNFEAIITDGYSIGHFYVQVLATDYAFSTDCDVVPLSSLPQPDDEFAQVFEPGMYLVNRDIAPGIYRGEGSCYWERLSDVTGTIDGIITNANPMGQFYMRVKESDFAVSTDCQITSLEILPAPSGIYPLSIEPGVYLVGRDILAGFYTGQGPYCYWERLSDVSGDSEAILARDNPQGVFTVRVLESDYAFLTECDLQRTGN